ncbi:RETNB protein, partial [Polypterus senegalus]|nr:RETNB protein [Polypterus senegalus]
MKMIICLLALALVCLDETSAHGDIYRYLPSIIKHYTDRVSLSCTAKFSVGEVATCPTGYSLTGCGCGYGCNYWIIQNEMTCRCYCSQNSWTTARCCKINFN